MGAVLGLGLGPATPAATAEAMADRCLAAEAVVRYAADAGARALGRPAPSLGTVKDDVIFQAWPSGPPPREIFTGLNAEQQRSVLDCPLLENAAVKAGLQIAPKAGDPIPTGVYAAYASLPVLSSDRTVAASVINTTMGGRGATEVVVLTRRLERWSVSDHFVVAFS